MAKPTPAAVFSHWYTMIENLQASTMEFFNSVEVGIRSRKVPNASPSRVEWKEGGLFSHKREYLRIKRENLIFDICGAPFGNGFFVSWWLGEARPSPIIPTITAVAVVSLLNYILGSMFGDGTGLFLTLLSLVAIFLVLGVMISGGNKKWDVYLLVIPVIGPLFERFFRPLTYYRMDNALMFQQAIHASVLEVVDTLTKTKGLRMLSESERKPILKEFWKK